MKEPHIRTRVAILAAALALGALQPPAASADTVDWTPCPEPGAGLDLECTRLTVPLDYRHPDRVTIEIAISRHLRPTTPVHPVVPPYALGPDDVAERATLLRPLAAKCASSPTGSLLPHINTSNTARDMDRIRAALGERRISYLGVSYGSYLGAAYASMFPHRADRIVLDSVTGPGGLDTQAARWMAIGFELRFPDFAAYAVGRHATYGLGTTPEQIEQKYYELAERLDQTPMGEIDGSFFRIVTFTSFYSDTGFPSLAELWQQIDRRQTTQATLASAADLFENSSPATTSRPRRSLMSPTSWALSMSWTRSPWLFSDWGSHHGFRPEV